MCVCPKIALQSYIEQCRPVLWLDHNHEIKWVEPECNHHHGSNRRASA